MLLFKRSPPLYCIDPVLHVPCHFQDGSDIHLEFRSVLEIRRLFRLPTLPGPLCAISYFRAVRFKDSDASGGLQGAPGALHVARRRNATCPQSL